MNLRKLAPALLLLAACTTSTATTAETSSVGLKPEGTGTKACCTKKAECSAEEKAACEKAKTECTDAQKSDGNNG